jgi:hypothetical protein
MRLHLDGIKTYRHDDFENLLGKVAVFTKHAVLVVHDDLRGRELFRKLLQVLKERPLKSLVFDQDWVDRQDGRGKRLVMSALNRDSWAQLSAALEKCSVVRSQIEHIQLPVRDNTSVAQLTIEGQDACARLDLFDCNSLVAFDTTELQPDRPMEIVACDHPACTGSFANGTPMQIVSDFIGEVGYSKGIKHLAMGGAPMQSMKDPNYRYRESLKLLRIASPQHSINITAITLRSFNYSAITQGFYDSINWATLEKLRVIQCTSMHVLWHNLMRFELAIQDIFIHLYGLKDPLWEHRPDGFGEFCKHFKTL